MTHVRVPTSLYSYTGQKADVAAEGATLRAILADLDRQYPGLRFRIIDEQDRIRQHIRIHINEDQAPGIDVPVGARDAVLIFTALSGG